MKKLFSFVFLYVCLFVFVLHHGSPVFSEEPRSRFHSVDATVECPPSFQLSSLYTGYLYPISVDDQWKIIDINGNRVGDTIWDKYVHPFDESFRYAFVSKYGKWYRIVSSGKVFPLETPSGYDVELDLGHGLVVLQKTKNNDPNGRIVYNILKNRFIGEHFSIAFPFRHGDNLLPIKTWQGEEKNLEMPTEIEIWNHSVHSLLDLVTGETIFVKCENEYARILISISVSEGIINFTVSDSSGNLYTRLMSRQCENIPIRSDSQFEILPFKNGVAVGGDTGDFASGFVLIDRDGRILTQQYKMIGNSFSGLSRVVPGEGKVVSLGIDSYGFVNTLGNVIVPAHYFDASHFRDGMALVRPKQDMTIYLINLFGDELYQLRGLPSFSGFNGLAQLWQTGVFRIICESKSQLLNIDGAVIFETTDIQTIMRLSRYPVASVH